MPVLGGLLGLGKKSSPPDLSSEPDIRSLLARHNVVNPPQEVVKFLEHFWWTFGETREEAVKNFVLASIGASDVPVRKVLRGIPIFAPTDEAMKDVASKTRETLLSVLKQKYKDRNIEEKIEEQALKHVKEGLSWREKARRAFLKLFGKEEEIKVEEEHRIRAFQTLVSELAKENPDAVNVLKNEHIGNMIKRGESLKELFRWLVEEYGGAEESVASRTSIFSVPSDLRASLEAMKNAAQVMHLLLQDENVRKARIPLETFEGIELTGIIGKDVEAIKRRILEREAVEKGSLGILPEKPKES